MDIINFLAHNSDIFLIVVGIFSLLVGSLLNVIIYRLPRMIQNAWNKECRDYLGLKSTAADTHTLNLFLPFSHCTNCNKTLKPWQNIPLVSYLLLLGKCAYCKAKISIRYPLVEILCCFTSVYVAWRFGVSWQTVGGLIFTWISICLIFIDLEYHLLPDSLTLLLLWIGLFLSLFSIFCDPDEAIIGAIGGYMIFALTQWLFHLLTGKEGMGQGDFKFLAALGAYLGWQMIPLIILLASVSGIILSGTFMIIKRPYRSVPLPFGPYLAVAGWISLMWGPDILHLYLHAIR